MFQRQVSILCSVQKDDECERDDHDQEGGHDDHGDHQVGL